MERLVRSCYKQKSGYAFAKKAEDIAREYGIDRVARLASNENPEPLSPLALKAAEEALRTVNRYPDERVNVLMNALRQHYGDYHFVTGVGMDGVIETLFRTLVEPGEKVAVSTPTFSFYALAAMGQGAEVVTVPREPDFSVDPKKLIRAAKESKVTVLCSPNNPTGNATGTDVVREILEAIEGVLFLDNAYVEFSGIDYLPLMKKHENLVLGRTFSKVYSLAGLRIGYAFSPRWLQPWYNRAGTPFTVNSVSMAAAAAALSDTGHADRYIVQVKRWRKKFAKDVRFPVLPSDANFVMIDVAPRSGDEVVGELARKGVIVRSCRSFAGLEDHYIRVSVGEDWENERFVQEINAL
ncbi:MULTISPECIES: histidinol-phosphate transaminase [unclassified Methanoregula]|uniref:histidinol-phosphate transaminase n=1 Tax=unclassified Methanoregula TaxID=2649730 RepID=UPI0009D60022|nr:MULTISPECIES: histidinol-phosphate transaminase [unclassified Methanoregula]OPX64851.1 MAG: histidinol-phosphate aminotransferase [Methanoregula sp. PtaB.Bin085]OPY32903.1 MAG: histidinol-phosphate aminotransferase [Methanoregula sp. PtaU1.Bin006]